jgi:hypothetical protein
MKLSACNDTTYVTSGGGGLLTTGNNHKEPKSEDSGYSELVLEFHMESRDHGDWQTDDDHVRKDVGWIMDN